MPSQMSINVKLNMAYIVSLVYCRHNGSSNRFHEEHQDSEYFGAQSCCIEIFLAILLIFTISKKKTLIICANQVKLHKTFHGAI